MKIKSIKLENFKRFSNLTVEEIPESAKLVVLIGPNGSGKSSLFEAFNTYAKKHYTSMEGQMDYLIKNYNTPAPARLGEQYTPVGYTIELEFHENLKLEQNEWRKVFYIRTAYRNDPEFKLETLDRVEPARGGNRIPTLIQNDMTVKENYRRLAFDVMKRLRTVEGHVTMDQFKELVNGELRKIITNLFNEDELIFNNIEDSIDDGTFLFDKGKNKQILYKNLSSGEKAAFDLVLDIIVNRDQFNGSVYCIDEPESHMHTNLQGRLLEALYKLVPDGSQLWIATHSIGMMRKARDLWDEGRSNVIFLNFNQDFDEPQMLQPIVPNRAFWKSVYDIALDDLSNLIAPKQIVLCEGDPSNPRRGFDARCYDKIFEYRVTDVLFLSTGGSHDVQNSNLLALIKDIVSGTNVIRLIDRDGRTPEGIEERRKEGVRVLNQRSIENYLLSDEIIQLLCKKKRVEDKGDDLIKGRLEFLKNNDKQCNDFKYAAGYIYNEVKNFMQNPGTNKNEFMHHIMAPLITPDTETYKELEKDIFGS